MFPCFCFVHSQCTQQVTSHKWQQGLERQTEINKNVQTTLAEFMAWYWRDEMRMQFFNESRWRRGCSVLCNFARSLTHVRYVQNYHILPNNQPNHIERVAEVSTNSWYISCRLELGCCCSGTRGCLWTEIKIFNEFNPIRHR